MKHENIITLPVKSSNERGLAYDVHISKAVFDSGFILIPTQTEEEEEMMLDTLSSTMLVLDGTTLIVEVESSKLLEILKKGGIK